MLKVIYFITAIAQSQNSGSIQGALSSKEDLMGGIFDRWINLIPENLIFNKILLPSVQGGENARVITDFYLYDPKKVGIAPPMLLELKLMENLFLLQCLTTAGRQLKRNRR